VIAALHDSKAFADEHLEAAIRGSAVAKEKDEELPRISQTRKRDGGFERGGRGESGG
jgi:hypothetical protein